MLTPGETAIKSAELVHGPKAANPFDFNDSLVFPPALPFTPSPHIQPHFASAALIVIISSRIHEYLLPIVSV